MPYILEKIKKGIVKTVNEQLDKKIVQTSDLVYPPNSEMGDLSLPVFALAKIVGKNPVESTKEIMNKLSGRIDFVSSMNAAGPYLNFKIKKQFLANKAIGEIEKHAKVYGNNKNGKGKKVMVEFSNANTHKEYHVGHLRNLSFGDSVTRILSANGFASIPVSYINDFGIHVAKTLWALEEYFKDEKTPENKGEFLGQVYVRASQEAKDNPLAKGMIEGIMKRIEAREGEEYALWLKTREWTIEQFDQIYKEMGVHFEKIYYENEYIDEGREMVNNLIKKGILKESEGAVIADFEEEGLGVLVVLRSDGTATYPVADIPLAKAKFDEYGLDESIYVVDNRQKLYLKQLFLILEKMGFKQKKIHLEYDFVTLPGGLMSSRSGNTVTYENLKQEMMKVAIEETKKRHKEWSEEKIKQVAWKISKGTMKFEMLKVGFDQIITFDIGKALSFQGYTAAYIQYTYARIKSILRRSGIKNFVLYNTELSLLNEELEHKLILNLVKYPEIVERSGREYNPSEICKYLFDLSQNFNDYYHKVMILQAEEGQKLARLILIKNAAQVIQNGLSLLGIEVVEEM